MSRNITIHPGLLQLRKDRWYIVPPTRYFEVTGYNISKESKYEMTISNDFTSPRKIPLYFKNAGTLTGDLPTGMETGNYKATYWKDGQVVEPYEEKISFDKYMGEAGGRTAWCSLGWSSVARVWSAIVRQPSMGT